MVQDSSQEGAREAHKPQKHSGQVVNTSVLHSDLPSLGPPSVLRMLVNYLSTVGNAMGKKTGCERLRGVQSCRLPFCSLQ